MVTLPLIEFHVVHHCNLQCRGCAHFSPLAEPYYADVNDFEQDLYQLSSKVSIKHLRLFGGEPLLHPQLMEFAKVARNILPATTISILSNGILFLKLLPKIATTLKTLDILMEFTVYPISNNKSLYTKIKQLLDGLGIKNYFDCIDSTKTLRQHILCKDKLENNYNCIMRNSNSVQLYDGKLYLCPLQAYSFILNNKFHTDFICNEYVDIYHCDEKEIEQKYNQKNEFCKYCREPIYGMQWAKSQCNSSEWIQ